ncbi:DUF333 domain-containing protein [Caballeronia sp. J97]|uniref:putative hemolysin n=1 Tax=Caballeronia sp. J97 TaxID=2805429 RepID=UPI002AB16150|nr:DUF333 domain-containing protein [Caballeronia sp. J97]
MKKTFAAVFADVSLAAASALFLSSCVADASKDQPAARTGLPNPASVNCVQRGGTLEIVKTAEGEAGICRFPNGRQCDEWALMRGECSPEK